MTKVQNNSVTVTKNKNLRLLSVSYTDNKRITPPLPSSKNVSLGNTTSYSSNRTNKGEQITEDELKKLKYDYKKHKCKQKVKIGEFVDRVGYCGTRCINKDQQSVEVVQGEKGGIYYANMQRCGSVWFCPDCMYKIMKHRANDVYRQLNQYKDKGKTVLFVTFTLQHKQADRLDKLHTWLLSAFNYANKHRRWTESKKNVPIQFLRSLEVLKGANGWHPHLHALFVGDKEIEVSIKTFIGLYKKKLSEYGLIINEHTVVVDKWNGKLDDMSDYLFKGMIEMEMVGGNLKKSSKGKNFFQLIDDNDIEAAKEYIKVMKGKRQYHHSKSFFNDIEVKSDAEILQDDRKVKTLISIPIGVYKDIVSKKIALHCLNEYEYGGQDRLIKLLELYDCEADIICFYD